MHRRNEKPQTRFLEHTQSRSTATVLAVAANFSIQASKPCTTNKIIVTAQESVDTVATKHKHDTATGTLCHTTRLISHWA